jgi:hypothetical protein
LNIESLLIVFRALLGYPSVASRTAAFNRPQYIGTLSRTPTWPRKSPCVHRAADRIARERHQPNMQNDEIKVQIVNYPDRKYLVMRYVDPVTGKSKARSTGTASKRDAERAAAKWDAELQEGRYQPVSRISWSEFRERHEREKLSSLSLRTASATDSALNHLERFINPAKLSAVHAATLSRFQSALRETGVTETTVATHLRHIRAPEARIAFPPWHCGRNRLRPLLLVRRQLRHFDRCRKSLRLQTQLCLRKIQNS